MPVQQLKEFLDSRGVKYVSIQHSLAYTAQEIAASAHVSGKEMVKTLVVKIDGRMALLALPASEKADLHMLREATGAKKVELATESEFGSLFPGCEVGAMPPFGSLFGLPVYIDGALAANNRIEFLGGTHRDVIHMKFAEFVRLSNPLVLHFAVKAA